MNELVIGERTLWPVAVIVSRLPPEQLKSLGSLTFCVHSGAASMQTYMRPEEARALALLLSNAADEVEATKLKVAA